MGQSASLPFEFKDITPALTFLQSSQDPRNKSQMNRKCKALDNIPVYILTLGSETREAKLKENFKYILGDDVSRYYYYGVHGRNMWGQQEDKKQWNPVHMQGLINNGVLSAVSGPSTGALTSAEVAVAFGDLQIMLDVLTQGHSHALILEDDANLLVTSNEDEVLESEADEPAQKKFITRFKCIMENLPKRFDIVRLGACFAYKQQNVISLEEQCVGLSITKADFALCAHGYIISAKACRVILETVFPLFSTIDHQIFMIGRECHLNDYDVSPHFLGQDLFLDTSDSTIGYTELEQMVLRVLHMQKISPERLINMSLYVKQFLGKSSPPSVMAQLSSLF